MNFVGTICLILPRPLLSTYHGKGGPLVVRCSGASLPMRFGSGPLVCAFAHAI